ncbi:haloacid dehalogenase-like hydrolase [Vagococcus sp. BWB3-3]|uniref:phosphoserine phosphatase n=1 Tax=Vagococcus allomyrinae TaxID=2794353 RepID=A0A940SYM8_9ENTE|nr:HAD family hydrolase [Vagococcus allomyrinae]MBP1044636.1 haloacid dehalogenase-like hydrolase [Vagococcus allomyrinae]
MLIKGNWEESIYCRLTELIDKYQHQQQYVVFDWDNTCIINDIGEAVFNYQLRELAFDLTPEELGETLVKGIPAEPFNAKWANAEGQVLNAVVLAADIVSSYQALYQVGPPEEDWLVRAKETLAYQEFIAKFRFLYDAIGDSFSADISYPWVTYFLGGKTAEEIHYLVRKTLKTELVASLAYETWSSPRDYVSQSGSVSIQFKRGIRLIPEIQQLMRTFSEKGIKVYIVSASNREVILPFATSDKFGYGLPESQIYGMRLKEQGGKMLPELATGVAQTQGVGKTATIKESIEVMHQHRGPILVAGDSDGDVAMLSDFSDTEIALIINRHKAGKIGSLVESAVATSTTEGQRFFVQGRDEVMGEYRKASGSILLMP